MRHARVVLALSLLGTTCVHRAPADAVVATPLGTRMDDYLTRLSGYGYSGATLVAKDGHLLLRKGYGLANDATGTPVTAATVFDIGSLAKTFTAAAVLLLKQRGRLSLDDSIASYLDGVPEDKRAIIGYLNQLHDRPADGGLALGGLGPVSEGLWAWIIGLGSLMFFAIWIAAKGAKAK